MHYYAGDDIIMEHFKTRENHVCVLLSISHAASSIYLPEGVKHHKLDSPIRLHVVLNLTPDQQINYTEVQV